ncbi:MAG: hypothetical protein ACOY30_12300 [Bacillota bacterium]
MMEIKKNRFLLIIIAMAGMLMFWAALAGAAGTGEPGSVDDPLVTRSYVEAQLNSRISGQVAETVKDYADKYMVWKVADLTPGQKLEAKAGAEIIVRAGKTLVVDPVGSGIPDVTRGGNITAGQIVELDHLLIVPRTDGRGISAQTKSIVMYRGEVQIR